MGLDFFDLNLTQHARLLKNMGILYSFPPEAKPGEKKGSLLAPPKPGQKAKIHTAPRSASTIQPPGSQRAPQPGQRPSFVQKPRTRTAEASPAAGRSSADTQTVHKVTKTVISQKNEQSQLLIPDYLLGMLEKAQKPTYSVWTYWELSQDMAGPDSPEKTARKRLWKALIQALKWPRGSVLFAPISVWENNNLAPAIDIFNHFLERVNPLYIFCFGPRALQAVFPESQFSFNRRAYKDKWAIQPLPGPEEMLPDNRAAKKMAWEILLANAP